MPTTEQLFLMWEAEMEFPDLRRDYVPPVKYINKPFTGELIGHIEYDEETKDFKIIPNANHSQ